MSGVADPRVAIVGGGISGLAAAYELTVRGIPFVLIERAARCGGVIVTERVGEYVIDAGPDALLQQKPAAVALCGELGITGRLRPQLTRTTYVVRHGRLRRLPEASVMGIPTRWSSFATSDAFSWRGKLRIAAEIAVRPRPHTDADDESIESFMGRRFGREAVEYLAEPLLAGIHGGDPSRLSMRAAFPRFLDLEARSGSVIRGIRHAAGARPPGAPFVALSGGMTELTDALMRWIPGAAIQTGTAVETIEREGGRYALRIVLVAAPPSISSRLLRSLDGELGALCGNIRAASIATVALGYRRSAVRHPLDGTGFVVPRAEGFRTRAVSWVSSKWADRAPADRVLLRAYIGGVDDPAAVELDDAALIEIAHADAGRALDIRDVPELTRVYRWREATPQLEVGHPDLMERIERRLAAIPGVLLSASGFRGTGIADCIADARVQAARAADRLAADAPAVPSRGVTRLTMREIPPAVRNSPRRRLTA
jgi:oxygen-dependent protoporphyrinogen oxidase